MVTKAEEKDETPIIISNLHKGFGDQKVLNGINLRIARGETTAVLGRSGGGKSVLLKLIIRLQTPDTGSIRIAGQEIADLDEEHLNEVRKKAARKNRESMASWHRFCVAIHEPPTEPSLGKRQGNPCSSLASSLIDF